MIRSQKERTWENNILKEHWQIFKYKFLKDQVSELQISSKFQ